MSQRNAPCSCGSGKKYKACCGVDQKKKSNWMAAAVVGVFLIGAAWALSTALMEVGGERQLPEGWVWNEEHGHPHRVGGSTGFVEPPAGSVWVPEHGHFHDPNGNPVGGATPTLDDPPQPTEPPAGSVWVPEHGHFHDPNGNPVGGATPTLDDPPQPTEPPQSSN